MLAATPTFEQTFRELVLEIHQFLNDLDPARWRDEKASSLSAQLADIQARAAALKAEYAEASDQRLDAIRQRFAELEELLRAKAPSAADAADQARESWMRFRTDAAPAYDALAASLLDQDVEVPRLRPTNYARNVFHVLAAVIGVVVVEVAPLLVADGAFWVAVIACTAAIMGWTMELSRRVSERANRFMMWVFSPVAHPHEAHHVNSATWYTSALALLSLTGEPVVCAAALAILGVADPMAAIVGKRFGRTRFANGRSLEGTTAFVVSGGLAAFAAVMALHPEVGAGRAAAMALAGALLGGLAELWVSRIDDNLAIPVCAGAAAWAVLLF
jgi:dolichol kinase